MCSRPAVALSFVACLVVHTYMSAQTPQASPNSDQITVCEIEGKVLSTDGHPAPGVHVEVDDAITAIPVASTDTSRDGTFELYNIPQGNYEVVAESNDYRVADDLTLADQKPRLKLRLVKPSALPKERQATISVAQILIPEKAQNNYDKAQDAFFKGKYDQSTDLLNAALAIEPQFAKALTLRGLIEMQSGELQLAQQDLEWAMQIDPGYSSTYAALGAIYNHEGRFDDAMRVSERAVSLSPRSWQGYFEMAKSAIAKGMYQKGLQLAREAQRLSGNSFAAVHLIRAYALIPMKLYQDAKYELQTFLSRAPNGSNAKQAQMLLAQIEAAAPAAAPAAH